MGLRESIQSALGAVAGDPIASHREVAKPYLDMLPHVRPAGPGPGFTIGPAERWMFEPRSGAWFDAWDKAPGRHRVSLGIVLLEAIGHRPTNAFNAMAAPALLSGLARSVPFHDRDARQLVVRLAVSAVFAYRSQPAAAYAAAVIERAVNVGEDVAAVEPEIRALIDAISERGMPSSEMSPLRARLLRLVGDHADERQLFDDGDTWGAGMQAYIRSHPDVRDHGRLLLHLSSATSVKPTKKWLAEARPLLSSPAAEGLVHQMVDSSFETRLTRVGPYGPTDASPFEPGNASIVRGAYWAAAAGAWPWVAETLGRAALHWALSGRNDNYPRDQRLATTTATLLADIGTPAALAALGRVGAKVRNRTVAKTVAAALDRAAAAAGTSPSELLELAVPTLGLDADGRREIPVGPGAAIIAVDDDAEATLMWRGAGGRMSESVPKALADEDGARVAAAKAQLKELRKALGIERARLEDLLVEDRAWTYQTWSERYLGHALVRPFARRLIWRFGDDETRRSGMPTAGGIVAADGAAVQVDADASVRLWHPIDVPASEVAAWRAFLLERRVRQPFKQAFREVYLLAPAEEQTVTYSNRFAAHILDYPVARALMGARRWATNFLGPFDGGYEGIAKREFRSRGLRAEFYHDAIDPEAADLGPVAHCSTDQVRFYPLGVRGGDPVPLRDIPPVVFTEAMRDVDLFVSVSSIAADVNWQDNGEERLERFDRYWHDTAFEELGPTAASRREVLAWMIPQLAIGDRLELLDRWLRVRGDLRKYRIHLGSGNIAMEPNDQYLCIVPARGQSGEGKVFLPFDDDHRLSIILSKAQLLANDRAIKDPTILRQIQAR